MKTFALFAATCALALGAEATKAASAATITETINFNASGFPPGAPVDPVTGSFTITLDPTTSISHGTTITLDHINITPSANALFFTFNTVSGGVLVCSSSLTTICGVQGGHDSFALSISNFLSTPTFVRLAYAQSSTPLPFQTLTGSVSVIPSPVAGAGLPGLILACGVLLTLAGRRRRTV
jgi:hypothetical protein